MNLRICLTQIFHRQNPDDVVGIIRKKGHLDEKSFKMLLSSGLKANSFRLGYTFDQCQLISEWFFSNYDDVYEAISSFAHGLREEQNGNFSIGLEEILRWHDISQYLTEDLLVCAYLAFSKDEYYGSFSWTPFVNTDDCKLNDLLQKPLADIHAHLKGSSLNFDVNWICLMNHITNQSTQFDELESKRQSIFRNNITTSSLSLYQKAIIAAAIRLALFEEIKTKQNLDLDLVYEVLHADEILEALSCSNQIQENIDATRVVYGRSYQSQGNFIQFQPDYAIDVGTRTIDEVCAYSTLSGERFIMYSTMRKMLNEPHFRARYETLFYLYLLIKNEIRNELVQVNTAVGFDNFSKYEDRKTLFLKKYPLYDHLLVHLSVASFFNQNEETRKHETRIAPKSKYKSFIDAINETEKGIQDSMFGKVNKPWRYGYDYHFIKIKDTTPESEYSFLERDHKLRDRVKKEAINIARLVNSNEFGEVSHISNRILGIDAANSEILTRPEAFAQAFRFLRNNHLNDNRNNPKRPLRVTYHVGEDFVDVIDGLRAVDELLLFMNYRHGDRLGHALVLGVNVMDYYKARKYSICMTQQMLLDNVAWLYFKLKEYGGYESAKKILKGIYDEICPKIYDKSIEISTYYCSWLLRGDCPALFEPDGTVLPCELGPWESAALNEKASSARNIKEACKLYYLYHYDESVKTNGNEMTEFTIDDSGVLIQAITSIQYKLCQRVQALGIAIESNPTSNFKIGEIDRYDQHPIYKYFDYRKDKRRFHISTSINTDDKGIFATSIEREYAIIYAAIRRKLELQRPLIGINPDIDNWIDIIRENSMSQSFL